MKSLNDTLNNKIFSKKILKWLDKEGFSQMKNDSYCFPNSYDYEDKCLCKKIYSNWDIGIYIFSCGIGVDIDYDCGGNSSTYFYDFKYCTFEEAYDQMVDMVNKYK